LRWRLDRPVTARTNSRELLGLGIDLNLELSLAKLRVIDQLDLANVLGAKVNTEVFLRVAVA